MSFFNELKRRNVVKVGVAYGILAWLLLQVIDVVLPNFGAPQWVVSTLMFIVILGFPITLVLSWVFEMTPQGIQTQQAVDAGAPSSSGNKLNAVIMGLMALAIVFMAVDNYVLEESAPLSEVPAAGNTIFQDEITATVNLEKSVAVLPFVNLSSDPEQEYFSDGLSEEILNQLVQYDELRVIARTSSFAFKGVNMDLREIGEQLGVSFLLEGSVRKANNDLRITAQLIRADDGSHLWSQTYDRELNNIFAIQDEIAMAVATALSITLDAGEFSLALEGTNDLDAYDVYLRGLELYNRRGSGQDYTQAMEYFREAVQQDPGFLRAWRGYYASLEGMLIYVPEQADQVRQEMDRARLQLAESAPQSAVYRGILASWSMDKRNWQAAEDAYIANGDEVVGSWGGAMQPLSASTGYSYSTFLLNIGRVEEAGRLIIRNTLTDPLSLASAYIRQIMYYIQGRFADADQEYQRALTLEGDHQLVDQMNMLSTMDRDDVDAEEKNRVMQTYYSTYGNRLLDYQSVVFEIDNDGTRLEALRQLLGNGEDESATKFIIIAFWASVMDDTSLSLEALRRSFVDFGGTNLGMLWSPMFKTARAEPAFKDIVQDLGFVEYWRATGNWPDMCRPLEGSDDFECF